MSNITNYSYLIQSMFGGGGSLWGTGSTAPGMFQFSQLNSSSIQSQLKAAGIDTSSKQYKAAIQQMTKNGCTGAMYTSVQCIKNLMSHYNSDGDFVDDSWGIAGLEVTDQTGNSYKKIIDIPESSRDEIFEYVKNNYLQSSGMQTGNGVSEIYKDMYVQMKKEDRLSAGYTLTQYRKAYGEAFVSAIKAVDPTWTYGSAISSTALNSIKNITRESVEANLVQSGNTFAAKSIDYSI